jgi:pyrroloquinoline quinone biosynthesis protein B
VLGTAQDGGLPHASCRCERCAAAGRDPHRRRRVSSLAIHLPTVDRTYLIDATPDVREQLDAVHDWLGRADGGVDRSPLSGVLLTHAHIGHYTGLAFFGREAVHTSRLPVYCSSRMAGFLRTNGPWSQLVAIGNIALEPVEPGARLPLAEGVEVEIVPVPHRQEYSDTLGFLIRGPSASLLYVPDTDAWEAWDPPLVERLQGVDVAILDGTFYSPDELPGRDMASIGHPLITTSMDLLQPLVAEGELRVYFTHLNHSNPALEPDGPERKTIEARGFRILDEGQLFPL